MWTSLFWHAVPDKVVEAWTGGVKSQVIGQAEILPVVLARTTWPEYLNDAPNFTFVDNNSARYALISGYSPVLESARLVSESWKLDAKVSALSWFARVPSPSNIADGPSRLDFSELEAWPGSKRCTPTVPAAWGRELWEGVFDVLCQDRS